MRWLLAGCSVLAVIHLSVALDLSQRPRFWGLKGNHDVKIYCSSKPLLPATVRWYKANEYDDKDRVEVWGGRFEFRDRNHTKNAFLLIKEVQVQDNGVYFCKMNDVWGPGTQLLRFKPIERSHAQNRSMTRDAFILLQGLLLAAIISAVLRRWKTMSDEKEDMYEEPEIDHIYEGLAIERCDAQYEELSEYAQVDGAEAPWERD